MVRFKGVLLSLLRHYPLFDEFLLHLPGEPSSPTAGTRQNMNYNIPVLNERGLAFFKTFDRLAIGGTRFEQ